MEKEFVSYSQALALKELGFDEPCLGERTSKLKNLHVYVDADEMYTNSRFLEIEKERYEDDDEDDYEEFETSVTAPLYQQAFRWFRNTHGLYTDIFVDDNKTFGFMISYFLTEGRVDKPIVRGYTTYEEAEQACLDKLIKIVKDGIRN